MLVFEYQRERNAVDKSADLERQKSEKETDLRRKGMEYRESLLLSILTRAMAAYRQTKKARRILRARAISGQKGAEVIQARLYDECLDRLNDAQLDFVNLARDVGTSEKAFSDAQALKAHLHSMENYLGDLIAEFEESRRSFSGEDGSLPLSKLPLLTDFCTAHEGKSVSCEDGRTLSRSAEEYSGRFVASEGQRAGRLGCCSLLKASVRFGLPSKAPGRNGIAERWVGSCLTHDLEGCHHYDRAA